MAFTRRLVVRLAAACAIVSSSLSAAAATLVIDFDGTVQTVTAGIQGSLALGAPVHGHIVIDTGGLAPNPTYTTSNTGDWNPAYEGAISYSLSVGSYTWELGPPAPGDFPAEVYVHDEYFYPPPFRDWFGVAGTMYGPSLNGIAPRLGVFQLFTDQDVIPDVSFPSAAEISAFGLANQAQLNFLTFRSSADDRIYWQLDRYSAVPEPTWFQSFGLAACAVLVRARARRRFASPVTSSSHA